MSYNHGWEKQQTQRPKGSGPKMVRQAKKPTKRNLAMGQKDHFKSAFKVQFEALHQPIITLKSFSTVLISF